MNQFEHISVVVQGPVQNNYQGRSHHEEGITQRCLASVREHLPGATLILSTWPEQDLSSLVYDQLVISPDPGKNQDGYCPDNYYRQITSTKAGLAKVTTPYAVKLRSDNFLIGNQFVELQQRFNKTNLADQVFDEKVVVNANLFRKYSRGHKVIMSPSDFFYYGTTTDLNRIWRQPEFLSQPFSQQLIDLKNHNLQKCALEAEQVYCQIWLRKLTEQAPLMAHRFDFSQADLVFWQRFLASNIVIAEPEQMGLGLRKASIRKLKRANEYSHIDWLKLYQTYCDPHINVPLQWEQLRLMAMRAIKQCRPKP